MKILFLGPSSSFLDMCLKQRNLSVVRMEDPISLSYIKNNSFSFCISYRYRHIVKKDVIDFFAEKIINLHISYLPWNRGADPNLWSFLENTPFGVSIHCIDKGIDTGNILVQRLVEHDLDIDTLRTSYVRLNNSILELFNECSDVLLSGKITPSAQLGAGSTHKSVDKERYSTLLFPLGWDTPVRNLLGKGIHKNE